MIILRKLILILAVLIVVAAQLLPGAAMGAATNSGQALEIAPPLINLRGSPGQTISAQVYIRDVSNSPLIVTNQIDNFVANGESGVPKILLNNNQPDPYSLQGFIQPIKPLLLKPQQVEKLNINVAIPLDASPGGHYGVIRFSGQAPSLNGKNGVAVSASLGALVLLTVNGNIIEHLSLSSFNVSPGNGKSKPSSFLQGAPFTLSEVLLNSGNEHVIPTGIVTIKDMFGREVMAMNINGEQGNILPSSKRRFQEVVTAINSNHKLFFGRYSASINIDYGTPKKTLTGTMTFWVIPINLIVLWIVVLIGGFFLIRWLIKRYNQHILDKAQNKPKK